MNKAEFDSWFARMVLPSCADGDEGGVMADLFGSELVPDWFGDIGPPVAPRPEGVARFLEIFEVVGVTSKNFCVESDASDPTADPALYAEALTFVDFDSDYGLESPLKVVGDDSVGRLYLTEYSGFDIESFRPGFIKLAWFHDGGNGGAAFFMWR